MFEITRNDAHEYVPISAWKAALNDESKPWPGKAGAAGNDEALVEHGSRQVKNRHTNEENVIARGGKHAVHELLTTEPATMVYESLDGILGTSFHKRQSSIRSVVYQVVQQVMLDLLRMDVIGEMIEAQIAKLYNMDVVTDGLSTGC